MKILYNGITMRNDVEKIVLCSDSHGLEDVLMKLSNTYQDASVMIHCGDSELPDVYTRNFVFVHGNNDYCSTAPFDRILTIGNHRIFITHGHHYLYWNDKSSLVRKAKAEGCDICCFGHTHCYFDEEIDGVRMLNPGSLRCNRDGKNPSYMLIELDGEKIRTQRKEVSDLYKK